MLFLGFNNNYYLYYALSLLSVYLTVNFMLYSTKESSDGYNASAAIITSNWYATSKKLSKISLAGNLEWMMM